MALEAKNLFFRYGRKQPWVIENVSLKVERGERVAVSGPSGSGKTTLSMMLSGYLEPTDVIVLLDGSSLPKKGVFPVQLVHQHPEKTINPRWRMKKVLEECGDIRWDLLEELGIERAWLKGFPANFLEVNFRDSVWRVLS